MMGRKAYLILENNDVFEGVSFGAEKDISGEVVFNTGMVGYPEGFTDPSYAGQILVSTYPLIGNYGVPTETKTTGISDFFESDTIHIKGLAVSSYVENNSHWQSKKTLASWLKNLGIPAISGIDTRMLTQTLREKGVMKGILSSEPPRKGLFFHDPNTENLVEQVSCKKPIRYGTGKPKILLIDCGVKFNQIRILVGLGATVIRVPWNRNPWGTRHPRARFAARRAGGDPVNISKNMDSRFHGNDIGDFDAIIISNGPGDPKMVKETISTVQEALTRKIPTFGICLGNQILALAAGADTYKLKYGHRGQNQPVQDTQTKKCYVTTHNHGFAVNTDSLPPGWKPWYTNLNDGTNEGIFHETLPFFSVQFHPEATPGPTDTEWIFEYFIKRVKEWNSKNIKYQR